MPASARSIAVDVSPLVDGSADSAVRDWRPIHDVVMGGVSSGGPARHPDGHLVLQGHVSLDNNGGFASFRTAVEAPDLSDHDGLRLHVRGDGQVYRLSVRVDGAWDGVSWQAPFATRACEWTIVDIPFESLVPRWHGRLVARAGPFDARRVRQIGLSIADKQEGPFRLELRAVESVRRDGDDVGGDGSRAAARRRTDALAAVLDAGSSTGRLLDQLRWNERLLVVSMPDDLDAEGSRQVGHFLATGDALADRELRIVELLGAGGGRLAGRTLAPEQVNDLRSAWDLDRRRWAVALVGKDGGVKARWDGLVEPAQVFALIDAMPMRQRELAQRGG